MIGWVWRAVQAAAVGVAVYLLCVFLGGLLALIGAQPATYIGKFLEERATAFAVLAALFYLAGGFTWRWPFRPVA